MNKLERYLIAIGKLVINFNAAEHSVRRLCWRLIDETDEDLGSAITKDLDACGLEILANRLVNLKLKNTETYHEAKEYLRKFEEARIGRNDYAHAIYRIPNEATDLSQIDAAWAQHRKKGSYTIVEGSDNLDSILNISGKAYDCSIGVDSIIEKISGN